MRFCARCANERWVCEAHGDLPWGGDHGCQCGAPGKPCPACNKVGGDDVPEMPEGFRPEAATGLTPVPDDPVDRDNIQEALRRLIEAARRKH